MGVGGSSTVLELRMFVSLVLSTRRTAWWSYATVPQQEVSIVLPGTGTTNYQ